MKVKQLTLGHAVTMKMPALHGEYNIVRINYEMVVELGDNDDPFECSEDLTTLVTDKIKNDLALYSEN